jgi:hypothetical protein
MLDIVKYVLERFFLKRRTLCRIFVINVVCDGYVKVAEHFLDEGVVNGFEFTFFIFYVQVLDGIVPIRVVNISIPGDIVLGLV